MRNFIPQAYAASIEVDVVTHERLIEDSAIVRISSRSLSNCTSTKCSWHQWIGSRVIDRRVSVAGVVLFGHILQSANDPMAPVWVATTHPDLPRHLARSSGGDAPLGREDGAAGADDAAVLASASTPFQIWDVVAED